MKNLKKLSLLLLINFFLIVNIAKAGTIKVHIPTTTGGNPANMAKLVIDELKNKGWQFDVKYTGNYQLSLAEYTEATQPFILLWGTFVSSDKKDSVYLKAADDSNLVGFLYTSPNFLCTAKDLSIEEFYIKKYKVGTVMDKLDVQFLDNFTNHINNKHINVLYRNSGDIEIAVASGEIDFFFSTRGAKLMSEKKAKCFFQTGNTEQFGIPSFKSKFPKLENNTLIIGAYLVAKNFPREKLEKLRNDIAEVTRNYQPLIEYADKTFLKIIYDDIPTQINILKTHDLQSN
jgi:hypothetical protein